MSPRYAWLFLAMAAVTLPLANGRWSISFAAWLAPLFLLLFLDSQPHKRGLKLAFAVQVSAFIVNWWGMIPAPGFLYYLIAAIYAGVYFLPFWLHRWLSPRMPGFGATLILPASWVGLEFLFQKAVTPYGSWGSIAYTQVDHLALLQLSSITGMAGISFLMLWFASTAAWAIGRGDVPLSLRFRGGLAYLTILVAVHVGGALRLAAASSAEPSVKVAMVTPSASLNRRMLDVFGQLLANGGEDPELRAEVEQRAKELNDDLLERTRRAARNGAQIVVWSEHAARLTPAEHDGWIEEAARLAREEGVFLFLGAGVWKPNSTPSFENKVVVVTDTGEVAAHYQKARPIAGAESSLIAAGDSEVFRLDSRYGRLGAVICHDLDFPDFVRQAGRSGVDVLFGPSSDWDAITPFHGRMAIVRSIENGSTLVRPCENGLSVAVDPYGRRLAAFLDRGQDGSTFTMPVPRSHVSTLYPRLGDWFAYLCLVGFVALAVSSKNKLSAPN